MELVHHQDCTIGSKVIIFMDICDGSLKDLLPDNSSLSRRTDRPRSWVTHFVSGALSGLGHIHENNVVHGGLRPENVLYKLDPTSGRPTFKIADLGLAKNRGYLGVGVTTACKAPEDVFHGKTLTASNIYAFGLIFLEAIGMWDSSFAFHRERHETTWRQALHALGIKDAGNYGVRCEGLP